MPLVLDITELVEVSTARVTAVNAGTSPFILTLWNKCMPGDINYSRVVSHVSISITKNDSLVGFYNVPLRCILARQSKV